MADLKLNIDSIFAMLKLDKNKKETLYLVGGVFFLIIFIYLFIFVKPKVGEFISLFRETNTLRSDINETKDILSREALYKKRLMDMQGKVVLYEEKLPAEREVSIMLEELSKMAKETYVKILGISPVETLTRVDKDQDKPYKELPIMINAHSGYHQLGQFINRMENTGRFMKISDIDIRANPNNKKEHSVDLIVSTYVLLREN